MKALTYIGPAAAVDVPLPPDFVETVTVVHGESHEFEPEHWRSLLEQSDNWIATSDYGKQTKSKPEPEPVADEPATPDDGEGDGS